MKGTREEIDKINERANQMKQKLDKAKEDASKVILELLTSRNLFTNTNLTSNFGALNMLLWSEKMMADAKEWSLKAAKNFTEKNDTNSVKLFTMFAELIDEKTTLEKRRSKWKDMLFDEKEVNGYIYIIGEYIKRHTDQHIAFIDAVKDVEIKKLTWNVLGVDLDTERLKFQETYEKAKRTISPNLSAMLLHMYAENINKQEWIGKLTLKWLTNIAETISRYSEKETKLVDEEIE